MVLPGTTSTCNAVALDAQTTRAIHPSPSRSHSSRIPGCRTPSTDTQTLAGRRVAGERPATLSARVPCPELTLLVILGKLPAAAPKS